MKIGISIGYGTANFEVPIRRIIRAEELGYDSVWASETYSTDAFTPLAFIAAHTRKIKLGTGIAALSARWTLVHASRAAFRSVSVRSA